MSTLVMAAIAVWGAALIVLVVALPQPPRRARPRAMTSGTAPPTNVIPLDVPAQRQRVAVLDGVLDDLNRVRLQRELGDGYMVGTGPPAAGDIVVTDDRDLADVAALHAIDATVLVAVREEASERTDQRVVRALDHGADACLVRPNPPELAAHLRALHRRRPATRSATTGRSAGSPR